jgi:hypothetical protein
MKTTEMQLINVNHIAINSKPIWCGTEEESLSTKLNYKRNSSSSKINNFPVGPGSFVSDPPPTVYYQTPPHQAPQDHPRPVGSISPEQQKLLLGERLYPMIQKSQPQLSGKITGMLLDSGWSIEELFSLLGDEEKLNQKIEEAVGVLKRAQQQQEADGTDEYQDQPGDDGEAH